MNRKNGFTLIELMITVAIIGILAATAVAGFQIYQMRTKRVEALTNVEALAKMETSFFGEYGVYVGTGITYPNVPLDPLKKKWDAVTQAAFGQMGFQIDGAVFHSYGVNVGCGCVTCFTAHADGDLDNDGGVGSIAFFHAVGAPACPTLIAGFVPNTNAGVPILDRVAVVEPAQADDF